MFDKLENYLYFKIKIKKMPFQCMKFNRCCKPNKGTLAQKFDLNCMHAYVCVCMSVSMCAYVLFDNKLNKHYNWRYAYKHQTMKLATLHIEYIHSVRIELSMCLWSNDAKTAF